MTEQKERIIVNNWRRFLHSLSTTGGDVFVLVCLFAVCLLSYLKTGDNMVKESTTLILGALLGLLRGKSNQQIVEVDKHPPLEEPKN